MENITGSTGTCQIVLGGVKFSCNLTLYVSTNWCTQSITQAVIIQGKIALFITQDKHIQGSLGKNTLKGT